MLTIEADIYEYVRMSYVDKNILGPLVHMYCTLVKLLYTTHTLTCFRTCSFGDITSFTKCLHTAKVAFSWTLASPASCSGSRELHSNSNLSRCSLALSIVPDDTSLVRSRRT